MSSLSPKTQEYLQTALDKLNAGEKLGTVEQTELEKASKLTGPFGDTVRDAFKKAAERA